MTTLSGRCLCGKVTWVTSAEILWSGHCHCDSCRRATAAPFTSFFGVPRGSVDWSGTRSEHLTSQGQVSRTFCAQCGTQMSYQNTLWPDETHVYAACLDDPTQFEPQAHYYYGEKLDWVMLDDDLPKHMGSADAPVTS